jgi:Tfp pilus assembly protein PilX
MARLHHGSARRTQRGSALLISIIFLVVLGLLGMASMSTSRIELRMANNTEARTTAYQTAQALTDAVVATPSMTPVVGAAGYTLCTPNLACDAASINMPAGELADAVTAGHLSGTAELTAPGNSPPPRGLGFSADKFSASSFEVSAAYDRTDEGLGAAVVTQGIIVVTPLY